MEIRKNSTNYRKEDKIGFTIFYNKIKDINDAELTDREYAIEISKKVDSQDIVNCITQRKIYRHSVDGLQDNEKKIYLRLERMVENKGFSVIKSNRYSIPLSKYLKHVEGITKTYKNFICPTTEYEDLLVFYRHFNNIDEFKRSIEAIDYSFTELSDDLCVALLYWERIYIYYDNLIKDASHELMNDVKESIHRENMIVKNGYLKLQPLINIVFDKYFTIINNEPDFIYQRDFYVEVDDTIKNVLEDDFNEALKKEIKGRIFGNKLYISKELFGHLVKITQYIDPKLYEIYNLETTEFERFRKIYYQKFFQQLAIKTCFQAKENILKEIFEVYPNLTNLDYYIWINSLKMFMRKYEIPETTIGLIIHCIKEFNLNSPDNQVEVFTKLSKIKQK